MTDPRLIARAGDIRCIAQHYEDYNRERTRQCICKATHRCSCGRLLCADDAKEHKSWPGAGVHKLTLTKKRKSRGGRLANET